MKRYKTPHHGHIGSHLAYFLLNFFCNEIHFIHSSRRFTAADYFGQVAEICRTAHKIGWAISLTKSLVLYSSFDNHIKRKLKWTQWALQWQWHLYITSPWAILLAEESRINPFSAGIGIGFQKVLESESENLVLESELESRILKLIIFKLLKADRPHPRNYPHTPTDYRHTDNNLGLVMLLMALHCTRQSRAHNIDHCAPENWPWPLPVTLTHDLDPTFDLDLEAR